MFQSTVDWCESNYVISTIIAEFWNTVTFFPILFSAFYWKNNFPRLFIFDKTFHHIFWYLVLVSIGTAFFHATLLYNFQLLDELPMVLLAAKYIYLLVSFKKILFISDFYLKITNFLLRTKYSLLYLITISYFYSTYLQIGLFHSILKIYELFIFIFIYKINSFLQSTNYNNIQHYNLYRQKVKYHSVLGVLCYSLAGLFWILENLFCEQLRHFQFHALWHIISSMGIYHLNCIISYLYMTNNLLLYYNL